MELTPEFYAQDPAFLTSDLPIDIGDNNALSPVALNGSSEASTDASRPSHRKHNENGTRSNEGMGGQVGKDSEKKESLLWLFKHRSALESEPVSSTLHKWIDLTFGVRQAGTLASEAFNVFHPSTYATRDAALARASSQERLLQSKSSTAVKQAGSGLTQVGCQIEELGQVPLCLFTTHHPQRKRQAIRTIFDSGGISERKAMSFDLSDPELGSTTSLYKEGIGAVVSRRGERMGGMDNGGRDSNGLHHKDGDMSVRMQFASFLTATQQTRSHTFSSVCWSRVLLAKPQMLAAVTRAPIDGICPAPEVWLRKLEQEFAPRPLDTYFFRKLLLEDLTVMRLDFPTDLFSCCGSVLAAHDCRRGITQFTKLADLPFHKSRRKDDSATKAVAEHDGKSGDEKVTRDGSVKNLAKAHSGEQSSAGQAASEGHEGDDHSPWLEILPYEARVMNCDSEGTIIFGCGDGTLSMSRGWRRTLLSTRHHGGVSAIASDGKLTATGGEDGVVLLWDRERLARRYLYAFPVRLLQLHNHLLTVCLENGLIETVSIRQPRYAKPLISMVLNTDVWQVKSVTCSSQGFGSQQPQAEEEGEQQITTHLRIPFATAHVCCVLFCKALSDRNIPPPTGAINGRADLIRLAEDQPYDTTHLAYLAAKAPDYQIYSHGKRPTCGRAGSLSTAGISPTTGCHAAVLKVSSDGGPVVVHPIISKSPLPSSQRAGGTGKAGGENGRKNGSSKFEETIEGASTKWNEKQMEVMVKMTESIFCGQVLAPPRLYTECGSGQNGKDVKNAMTSDRGPQIKFTNALLLNADTRVTAASFEASDSLLLATSPAKFYASNHASCERFSAAGAGTGVGDGHDSRRATPNDCPSGTGSLLRLIDLKTDSVVSERSYFPADFVIDDILPMRCPSPSSKPCLLLRSRQQRSLQLLH